MENQTQQNVIRKKMEKSRAIEILTEIKQHICGVDIDEICNEDELSKSNELQQTYKRVIQAIQCGLVYWDETNNCLIQKLINPVKCGELEATEFKYKNRPTIDELQAMNVNNEIEAFIGIMATITARPTQLIGQLYGQDLQIATGCMSFFVS